MVLNYNNHFNECSVSCYHYSAYTNTGCSHYGNHTNSSHNNHSNKTYGDHYNHTNNSGDYKATYSSGSDGSCSDYSETTYNYYSENTYNDHKNEYSHTDHFNAKHPATTLVYSITEYGIDPNTPGNWGLIKDSVDDLKALRDAIMEMPNKKLSAGRGSSRKHFTAESVGLSQQQNADEKFDAGQKPKKEQFNETRENIKTLWKKIKGNELTDVPDEIKPNKKHIMQKKDYQKFVAKVDELAREDQSDFYDNHYNRKANR